MDELISDFDNWNPMADDFANTKFNSYSNNNACDVDDCSLYIRNIPATLSREAFIALLAENGRQLLSTKLYEPRPDSDVTIGLATFKNSRDAAEVLHSLNRKPPMNLNVSYSYKKNRGPSRALLADPPSRPPSVSTNGPNTVPVLGPGKGRGTIANSFKFPPLRIVLDGEKRTSFSTNTPEVASSQPSDLPKLIENPFLSCLACDNIAKFSCNICKKPYCSQQCQLDDWPKHKLSCKPWCGPQGASKSSAPKTSRDSSYVSESSGSESEKKSPIVPKSYSVTKPKQTPVLVKDIQTVTLPRDKQVQVKVSHIISPSKFWVQLSTANSLLTKLEKDLVMYTKEKPSAFNMKNVYCINEGDACKRISVLEEKSDRTVLVQFLDYGDSRIVSTNQVFLLPVAFREIPYQAICCRLGEVGERTETIWCQDDTDYFQMQSSEKESYTAHVLKHFDDTYEVSLADHDGLSLHSILTELKNALKNVPLSSVKVTENGTTKNSSSKQSFAPSVLSDLKNEQDVAILAQEFSEDMFWGILDDGSGLDKHVADLDNLLKSLNTKEMNLYAEEGDLLAGFSESYQQFYRCIVLERRRERFNVLFIDYGNKEEVSKLCELTPELMNKRCYSVCCSKPATLSSDEFRDLFSGLVSVSADVTDDNTVKLSFLHNNDKKWITCFPWYHGLSQVKPEHIATKSDVKSLKPEVNQVISTESIMKRPASQNGVPEPTKILSLQSAIEKRITSDALGDLPVDKAKKYCIKVVYIVNASKLFVQIQEKEKSLETMMGQLNKYCLANKTEKYSPVKNEVVCCKYKVDNAWYRGQVVGKKGNVYRVFFVDFGNEDSVLGEEMKPLPETLCSHKFALCVSLHKVKNEELKEFLQRLNSEYWEMHIIDASSTPIDVMFFQKGTSLADSISQKYSFAKASLKVQKLPKERSDVMLCHSEKDMVYVQQVKDTAAIGDLCHKINAAAAKMTPAKEVTVGNVYCALFSDGLWYRVSACKPLSSDQFCVTFIDFGNQETLDRSKLRELPLEFSEFPIFSIPVIPQNFDISRMRQEVVYPVEVTGEKAGVQLVKITNKKLPSLSAIKKTAFKEEINKAEIGHFEDGIYYCLPSVDADKYKALHDKLQVCPEDKVDPELLLVGSVVCAKSSDGSWYRGAVSKVIDESSCAVSFIDFGNSEVVLLKNIRSLPDDLVSHPIYCVPVKITNFQEAEKHLNANEPIEFKTLEKLSDGKQLVEIVLPKSTDLVKVSSLKKQLLPINETSDILLCHAEGEVMYCQLVRDQCEIKFLESNLVSAHGFETLHELPEVGSVVCAKCSDNVWYRGSVEETLSNACQICFIDYGNTETISLENIKILPTELSLLPIFSIPIKFSNLEMLQKLSDVTESGVITVQAMEVSAEGVQLVSFAGLSPKYQTFTSVDTQLLSDLPVEVTVCHEENGIYYVQRVSEEESLKEVMVIMQNPENLHPLEHTPQNGELLCVKFSDHLWYRGLIKESSGNGKFKVFFVDYGNTDEVDQKDMSYMPPSCASFTRFSYSVKLSEQTTSLKVNERYTVKRINNAPDDIHLVKVRPSVTPVFLSSMKSSGLEEDSVISIIFQNLCGNNLYYVTKSLHSEQINAMKKLLADFKGEDIFEPPSIDEILIVRGSDKFFYRGCVSAINVVPGFCSVLLLDSGLVELVPFTNMFYLPELFVSFPLFATKVALHSDSLNASELIGKEHSVRVVSRNGSIPSIRVFSLSHSMLSSLPKQYLPLQSPINVMVSYRSAETYFLHNVDQIALQKEVLQEAKICSSNNIVHRPKVGELLVAQSEGIWYRCCIEEALSCDLYKVHYIDYGNSEQVSKDGLCHFSEKLAAYHPLCFPVKFIDTPPEFHLDQKYTVISESHPQSNEPQLVRLVPESNSQQELPSPKEDGTIASQADKKYMYSDFNEVSFPSGETNLAIQWVVRADYVFVTPLIEENVRSLVDLTKEITEYCESVDNSSFQGDPPIEDEIVLAKFAGEWYRATVVKATDAPNYEVLFIDYGNSEVVPIDLLRRTQDRFMTLDSQVWLCHLTGFKFGLADAEKIADEINQNFLYKPLVGVVTTEDDGHYLSAKVIIDHLKKTNLITT